MFRPYMAIIRFFPFSLKVSLYKLRCGDLPSDYNSIMPMCRLVSYYINIYILALLVGVVWGLSSWGCELDVNLLFFRVLLSRGCQWLA